MHDKRDGWHIRAAKEFAGLEFYLRADGFHHYEDFTGTASARYLTANLVQLQHVRIKRCGWIKCEHPWFVSFKKSQYCSAQHSQNARTWRLRHGGVDPKSKAGNP